MHWFSLVVAQGLVLVSVVSPASAQPAAGAGERDEARPQLSASQELGARVGLALGGRTTPGGFHVAGHYLYQLSERDWFDSGFGFALGSSGGGCFRDREDRLICDHNALAGFSAGLALGLRRFWPSQRQFTPYTGAGLELKWLRYSQDRLSGAALPLWLGAGVRAQVAQKITVSGGARFQVGPAWFGRGIGVEPHIALLVFAGVDFCVVDCQR